MELNQLRTHNTKTFLTDSGELKTHFHVGHIHYFNKLGVGDGQVRFREIDFKLNWNEEKKGWEFLYHNFQPFIPEYADDWVDFRDLFEGKDQTVSFKAQCQHIKGRLVSSIENLTTENAVIYDNAFGDGLDYIIYFTRSQLKKVVRIREGFKPKTDLQLKWQLSLPNQSDVFRGAKTDGARYLLDTTRSKTFDSKKETLIGKEKNDGKEWFTYFRPFLVWDSVNLTQDSINVDYIVENGNYFITKHITADYFSRSLGDVFTDTTTSYYAGAGDGYSGLQQSNTWANVRGASSGNATSATATNAIPITDNTGGYRIFRSFFPIDTSGIGAGATVDSATFYTKQRAGGGLLVRALETALVSTSQASNTALTNDDYDQVGSTDLCDTRPTPTATYDVVSYALNASGLSAVNVSGYTNLGLRGTGDMDDVAPSSSPFYDDIYTSEQTGTDDDPYLEVTYTPPTADRVIDLSDSITVTENTPVQLNPLQSNVSDSITLTEDSSVQLNPLQTNINESLTLSEDATVQVNAPVTPTPSVNDSLTITEDVNPILSSYANVNDSITLSEDSTVEVNTPEVLAPLKINIAPYTGVRVF